jgi:hypothetical protein
MSDEKKTEIDPRFLDPAKSPLEAESPFDRYLDPSKSPLDGSSALAELYRSAFGSVENIQIDDLKLRRLGEALELLEAGEWKSVSGLSSSRQQEIADRIKDFRRKQAG